MLPPFPVTLILLEVVWIFFRNFGLQNMSHVDWLSSSNRCLKSSEVEMCVLNLKLYCAEHTSSLVSSSVLSFTFVNCTDFFLRINFFLDDFLSGLLSSSFLSSSSSVIGSVHSGLMCHFWSQLWKVSFFFHYVVRCAYLLVPCCENATPDDSGSVALGFHWLYSFSNW